MNKLTENQVTALREIIVAEPNTQTPMAVIAKAVLDLNAGNNETQA